MYIDDLFGNGNKIIKPEYKYWGEPVSLFKTRILYTYGNFRSGQIARKKDGNFTQKRVFVSVKKRLKWCASLDAAF